MQTETAKKTAGRAKTKPLFDLKKLRVDRYTLFPSHNLSASLDLSQTMHEGGQALRRLYHDSDKLVIVKYYKGKCSMCRVLQPLMEKVVKSPEFHGRIHFVELEVVQNKDVIKHAGLQGVPTCHIFYRGMLVDHFSGLLTKKSMKALIERMLATYEGMEEEAVAAMWTARQAHWLEEDQEAAMGELFEGIVYPIKGIMAPGRVLVPVHWNHLFDRGGHSVGIADRLGRRNPLTSGRLLDQFLDNENCRFDATSGSAFLRSLQKSDVVATKGRLTKVPRTRLLLLNLCAFVLCLATKALRLVV
jgi:thiol-disulfide isomerase/thioredoxin